MIDFKVMEELNNLYEYMKGAHHATNDENVSMVLHEACHRVNEIRNKVKITNASFCQKFSFGDK